MGNFGYGDLYADEDERELRPRADGVGPRLQEKKKYQLESKVMTRSPSFQRKM